MSEDDEFEDFPVEDWPQDESSEDGAEGTSSTKLWEKSWDDDDTCGDFAKELKAEMKRSESS